jgi:predicted membrane-bound mannosyltransferase
MSKDVINVGGEERVVREDTAKSYRGVIWALGSIAIFIIIAFIIFFVFFAKSATDGKPTQSPAQIENRRQGQ